MENPFQFAGSGDAALPSPDSLIVVVGRTPQEAKTIPYAKEITRVVSVSPANCRGCETGIDYNGIAHVPADFASSAGFKEIFLGNSARPRLSIGIGANWTSPFGPLRLDLAKAIMKQKGDDTKLFTFNVGTQF